MSPNEIKMLIETQLPHSQALVNSPDDVHFDAIIISPAFEGKTKVQQQQMIYGLLNAYLTSGEIHALSLKTYTPDLWNKQGNS